MKNIIVCSDRLSRPAEAAEDEKKRLTGPHHGLKCQAKEF